jgi:hypothetical protein
MSKINFIRGLIGEILSLKAQFGLNWEERNFKRSNLILTKLIDWNQGQNHKKINVLGSIRGQIETFCIQGPIYKRRRTIGA